jgi:hypothetical protein
MKSIYQVIRLATIAGALTVVTTACSRTLTPTEHTLAIQRMNQYTSAMKDIGNVSCETNDSESDYKVSCTYTDTRNNTIHRADCPYTTDSRYGTLCLPYNELKNVPAPS